LSDVHFIVPGIKDTPREIVIMRQKYRQWKLRNGDDTVVNFFASNQVTRINKNDRSEFVLTGSHEKISEDMMAV
jgi:hypothetical protein